MATVDECRQALDKLADRLSGGAAADKLSVNRSLACTITDLETAFHGRLENGQLVDIAEGDDTDAKIRLALAGDDLVALVNGELDFAKAWLGGRLKVNASVFDLMKLRSLL